MLGAILAVAYGVSEEFASVKIGDENINAPFSSAPTRNTPPNVQIINGVYETPLDHFQPTNPRRLRLVRTLSFRCVT